MNELETLHAYAIRFLNRVQKSIPLADSRLFIANLDEDISTLSDQNAAARISAALAKVKKCDYEIRNDLKLIHPILLAETARLVETIDLEKKKLSSR